MIAPLCSPCVSCIWKDGDTQCITVKGTNYSRIPIRYYFTRQLLFAQFVPFTRMHWVSPSFSLTSIALNLHSFQQFQADWLISSWFCEGVRKVKPGFGSRFSSSLILPYNHVHPKSIELPSNLPHPFIIRPAWPGYLVDTAPLPATSFKVFSLHIHWKTH